MATSTTTKQPEQHAAGVFDRLYTGEGGIDFVAKRKLWYWIAAVCIVLSVLAIVFRGFSLNIDFEGGTKMSMPAGDLQTEQVEETFIEATGVSPELTQIVGSGASATLEINSERLSEDQIQAARQAIFDAYHPKDATGTATPDAVGDSTVSESWGSTITNKMLLSMGVFLLLAFLFIAFRLKREMAIAAMAALLVDGIVIAGIYALFGLEVSPAAVIGLLTVLSFSIYDTVIVFDKVRENTDGLIGQRRQTYAEAANSAVNQTVMRSISTTVISALPILALLVVAVWMLGVGSLKDLALIQLIGVIEGVFSSIFLATPFLVSISNRRKEIKRHNKIVEAYRRGEDPSSAINENADSSEASTSGKKKVVGPQSTPGTPGGASWRPQRG